MPHSKISIEDIDPELEEIYAKLSPKSERVLRRKIKKKDSRAQHKHEGWLRTSTQLKKETKEHEATIEDLRVVEEDLNQVEAKLQVEERRRIEAESLLAAKEAMWKDGERRQKRKLDEVNNENEALQSIIADDTWTIESNQLAEGSRQHIAERVFCAMSPWLRSCVKGDSPSLSALKTLPFQYPGEIQERILGFPLSDLQVVSDGFQLISDRRTDLTHPVKHLLDNDKK